MMRLIKDTCICSHMIPYRVRFSPSSASQALLSSSQLFLPYLPLWKINYRHVASTVYTWPTQHFTSFRYKLGQLFLNLRKWLSVGPELLTIVYNLMFSSATV